MKYLIGFLTVLIFVILSVIYFNISKPVIVKKEEREKEKNITFTEIKPLKPKNIYFFPAKILYMKVDFKKFNYIIIYKIIVNNFDKYALFNIKTILEEYNVPYSLYKGKKEEIYIFFRNLSEANSIINLFKEYNFNIKIQKIKKRI